MEKESVGRREETNELLFQSDFHFGDGSYHSSFPEASSESEDGEECSDLPDSILAHLYFTSSQNNTSECSVIPQELEERYQRSLEMDSSPTPGPWYGNRDSSSSECSSGESSVGGAEERTAPVDHIIILSSDSDNSAPQSYHSLPAKKKMKVHVIRQKLFSRKSDGDREGEEQKQTKNQKRRKRKKKKKEALSGSDDPESKTPATTFLESAGGEASVPMVLDSDCEILEDEPPATANLWEINEKDQLGREEYEKKHGKGFQRYSLKAVRCNNCRQKGHLEDSCPQPKRYQRCYLCAGINHVSSQCKQSLCQYCFQPSHRGRPCHPHFSNPRSYCNRCYMSGHGESICPDIWRQFHNTTHLHDHLVKIPLEKQRKVGPAYCYKCGGKGHFGFECHQANPRGYPQPMLPLVARYEKGLVVNCRRTSGSNSPSSLRKGEVRFSNQVTGHSDNRFPEDWGMKRVGKHRRRGSSGLSSRRESGEISDSDDEDMYDSRVGSRWVLQEREHGKRAYDMDGEHVVDQKRQKLYDHRPGPPEPFLPLPTPPPPLNRPAFTPFLPGRSQTDPGRPLISTPFGYPCPPPPQSPTYLSHHHGKPSLAITIPARDPSYPHRRSLSSEVYRLPDDSFGPGPQTLSRRRYVHDFEDDQANFPRTPFSPQDDGHQDKRFPSDFPPSSRWNHMDPGAPPYAPNDGFSSGRREPHFKQGKIYDRYDSAPSHHGARMENATTTPKLPERRFSSPSPAPEFQHQRRNSRGFVSSHSPLHRRVSLQF